MSRWRPDWRPRRAPASHSPAARRSDPPLRIPPHQARGAAPRRSVGFRRFHLGAGRDWVPLVACAPTDSIRRACTGSSATTAPSVLRSRGIQGIVARADKPALVSEDDGLDTIGHPELVEQPPDVALDGCLLEVECLRDVAVGQTAAEQEQDVAFACGQPCDPWVALAAWSMPPPVRGAAFRGASRRRAKRRRWVLAGWMRGFWGRCDRAR